MKPPRELDEYQGRFADCGRAVGGEALLLVERAMEAGWGEHEAVVALADCALEYLQHSQIENGSEAAEQIGSLSMHSGFSERQA
jgi:hypothetical protein